VSHGHGYTSSTIDENQEFEAVHHIKTHRSIKILSALLWGMEVKMNGYEFRLFEGKDGGFVPGVVRDGKLICGMPDLSLAAFTKMCEEIPDEEYESIETNLIFNKMKYKG
jgi:hypothetical protein